jgi:hypothetical protein
MLQKSSYEYDSGTSFCKLPVPSILADFSLNPIRDGNWRKFTKNKEENCEEISIT